MSNIRIYTKDGHTTGFVPVQGTEVYVDDTPLAPITGLELVAEPTGVWTLKISVPVDPATLFCLLPK